MSNHYERTSDPPPVSERRAEERVYPASFQLKLASSFQENVAASEWLPLEQYLREHGEADDLA